MGGRPLLRACCLLGLLLVIALASAQHVPHQARNRRAPVHPQPRQTGARLQRSSSGRLGQHALSHEQQQPKAAVKSESHLAAAEEEDVEQEVPQPRASLQARGDAARGDPARSQSRQTARTQGGRGDGCPRGMYSDGDSCTDCLYWKPDGEQMPPSECRTIACPAGYFRTEGGCQICDKGSYSAGGVVFECTECPGHRTTKVEGSKSLDQCVCAPGGPKGDNCDECPAGKVVLESGKCGCAPGRGGASCDICQPGFFSSGGSAADATPDCKPCGSHMTSPPGAVAIDFCECAEGYGADRIDVPMEERSCVPCYFGTFNPGDVSADTLGQSRDGAVGIAAIAPAKTRRRVKGVPQILACQLCSSRNPEGGFTTLDVGSKASSQCICKPGYGGFDCSACAEGTYSLGGKEAVCQTCPNLGAGFTTAPKLAATSIASCVCRPGFGFTEVGTCKRCPANTYSSGSDRADCSPCPFGTTSAAGATSKEECRASPQACPIGQWAPEDAVSKEQCMCYPGFGAGNTASDPCTICPPGTFSEGKSIEKCVPCGFGYTSAEGSTSDADCRPTNLCPAGTAAFSGETTLPAAVSADECRCKAGYGSPTGSAPCHLCPMGTWSAGGSYEDCQPCPLGLTSGPGTASVSGCVPFKTACPQGQIAPPGAVSSEQCVCQPGWGGGETAKDPCRKCPAGTFGVNGTTQPCEKCPFGFSSAEGATSKEACFPHNACPMGTEVHRDLEQPDSLESCVCKPGFGVVPGTDYCRLCPAGTYAFGGDLSECLACNFTLTSAPGAQSEEECVPAAQPCPIGQIAPPNAVSAEQCACLPGYGGGDKPTDACSICPPSTWSPGGTTDRCIPCGFGLSSPEGSVTEQDCIEVDACPAGTVYREGFELAFSLSDCVCKPGYGSDTGSGICKLCPRGTFSEGGTMEQCKPCPWGFTSDDGSVSWKECRIEAQRCPIGQWAPKDAVSDKECRCYTGFGGGETPQDACAICPRGTYSANRGTDRCIPCPSGFTSEEGATEIEQCYSENACPAGQETVKTFDGNTGCRCRAGFGSVTGQGACTICPVGTFSEGGSNDACLPCPFGHTSPRGAQSRHQCEKMSQPCPVGQIAPPDAVSAEQCGCAAGFGGGATPQDACTVCPAGTYSPGGDTQPCIPCGFSYSSPVGAMSHKSCVQINACPVGAMYQDDVASVFSISDCVCKPGFGATEQGLCRVCARGTYSAGGTMEHCKSCGAGWSSEEGSISWHDCYQEFDAHGHVVHHSAHLHAAQQPQQSAARSSSSAQEAAQEVQRRR